MGRFMKSIKSSFRTSKKNVDVKKTEAVAVTSPATEQAVPPPKLLSSRSGSLRAEKVPLPTGTLGIKFAGSPPAITSVSATSPIADQIQVGQVVESIVIPGQKYNEKLDSATAFKLLKESVDVEGRVLILRSSPASPKNAPTGGADETLSMKVSSGDDSTEKASEMRNDSDDSDVAVGSSNEGNGGDDGDDEELSTKRSNGSDPSAGKNSSGGEESVVANDGEKIDEIEDKTEDLNAHEDKGEVKEDEDHTEDDDLNERNDDKITNNDNSEIDVATDEKDDDKDEVKEESMEEESVKEPKEDVEEPKEDVKQPIEDDSRTSSDRKSEHVSYKEETSLSTPFCGLFCG